MHVLPRCCTVRIVCPIDTVLSSVIAQVDMMERMGLDVTVIDSPWGEGANEEKLAELLKVCRCLSSACRQPGGL